ncbi:MAG: hypothetical protein EA409_11975 [Saprospirales bacterium]|nr:MAG: hypothetical protein EA409_11975 [Saprospirales bacterium]
MSLIYLVNTFFWKKKGFLTNGNNYYYFSSMKNWLYLTVFIVFYSVSTLKGQVPEYYQNLDLTTQGQELMVQLSHLVSSTHVFELSYTPGVWEAIKLTDLDPENNEHVLLIYGFDNDDGDFITDRTRGVNENCTQSDCTGLWNREHVLARSQANPPLQLSGAGTDVHNLRACDARMNEIRGNRRFAYGGSHAVVTPEGDFFPGEEWIGDVARMMMYMFLRYGDRCDPSFVAVGTSFYDPDGRMIDLLLEWNAADPVSEYELNRNEILEDLQGNRNPFIDNPYLATLIWGGPVAEDRWSLSTNTEIIASEIQLYPTISTGLLYFTNPLEHEVEYRVINNLGLIVQEGTSLGRIQIERPFTGWHYVELIHSSQSRIQKVYFQR